MTSSLIMEKRELSDETIAGNESQKLYKVLAQQKLKGPETQC